MYWCFSLELSWNDGIMDEGFREADVLDVLEIKPETARLMEEQRGRFMDGGREEVAENKVRWRQIIV